MAARAGLTKPTLYQHFASKEALVEAAMELRDREYRALYAEILAGLPAGGEEAALAAFDLLAAWLAEHPDYRGCSLTAAAVELRDPAHAGRRTVRSHKLWLRGELEEALRRAGCAEPEELADGLFFLLEGARVAADVCGRHEAGATARRAASRLLRAYGVGGGER